LNGYSCLTQNNRGRCEMVGSHYKYFKYVFNLHLLNQHRRYDGYVENIWFYRTSLFKNILVCKVFTIEETQRGGVDEWYTTL